MRRTRLLLFALILAAPFLAGCGDDGGSSDGSSSAEESSSAATGGSGEGNEDPADEEGSEAPQDLDAVQLIQSSPQALEEAGTARLDMTIEASGVTIDATGQFDFEAQQGAMTMTLPAPASGEFDIVFDGTTYFMGTAAFGGAVPGIDADWIRVDLEELASQTGIDPSQLPQGSSNPADALDALAAISEDGLEEVGTEEVRGVETTRYEAEIDMAAAIEQANEDSGGQLIDQEFADQFLAQYGDEPVPVEIWIDAEGLVHRQTMSFTTAGQDVSLELEMFDYGEPVDIQVPDPAETADFSELLNSIGGGTTPGG